MALVIACRVVRFTTPVGGIPTLLWNCCTALRVDRPKYPVGEACKYPAFVEMLEACIQSRLIWQIRSIPYLSYQIGGFGQAVYKQLNTNTPDNMGLSNTAVLL